MGRVGVRVRVRVRVRVSVFTYRARRMAIVVGFDHRIGLIRCMSSCSSGWKWRLSFHSLFGSGGLFGATASSSPGAASGVASASVRHDDDE